MSEHGIAVVGNICLAVMIVWTAGLAGWAIRIWAKHRKYYLFALLVSCLAAAPFEGLLDKLIGVTYAVPDGVPYVRQFQEDIPVWGILVYLGWYCTAICIFMVALERSWSSGAVWKLYGALVLFDAAAQMSIINAGLYRYVGGQPLRIFELPFTVPVFNAALELLTAVALRLFVSRAHGMSRILILPLALGALYGGNFFMSGPSIFAVMTGLSTATASLLGLVTILFSLLTVNAVIGFETTGGPMRPAPSLLSNKSV
ncbi:hypothetical protein [Nocardia crassostreae]|uniref:hypothetical protein n=1 Tax=Nocardia crassostreae TaxID=53428 RepID=UPI00083440B7|nr:hypothetical protein [Nocardia crassostreae]